MERNERSNLKNHLTDEQLNRWVDGEIAGEERKALESHLAGCPFCRTRVQELEELRRILASSLPVQLKADENVVWARVRGSIRKKAARCPLRLENLVWPSVLTLLYGMTMAILTVFMIAGIASVLGLSIPLLDKASYFWSLLLETVVVFAMGRAGMAISFLGNVSGASPFFEAFAGIAMEIVLLGGIAGLYMTWIASLGNNSTLRRN